MHLGTSEEKKNVNKKNRKQNLRQKKTNKSLVTLLIKNIMI